MSYLAIDPIVAYLGTCGHWCGECRGIGTLRKGWHVTISSMCCRCFGRLTRCIYCYPQRRP